MPPQEQACGSKTEARQAVWEYLEAHDLVAFPRIGKGAGYGDRDDEILSRLMEV